MTCKISVIIPAFNATAFLGNAIESVLQQTFKDWELILVDDGSTDSTLQLMEAYRQKSGRIRVRRQPNRGVSAARNAGLAETGESKYVIFLDADDVWEAEALSMLFAAIEADTQHVGVHAYARYVDKFGQRIRTGELEDSRRARANFVNGRVNYISPDEPTSYCTLLVACCIHTPGVVLFKRDILSKVGTFDESLSHFEDLDFYLRMAAFGTFKFVDQVVLNYRLHVNNSSAHRKKMQEGFRKVINRVAESHDFTYEQRLAVVESYPVVQRFFVAQKLSYCAGSMRKGDWTDSAKQLKYAAGHLAKMIRGRP